MAKRRICSIPECGKHVHCRGYCASHYVVRIRSREIPLIQTPAGKAATFIQKALSLNSSDCILWPYGKDSSGYGMLWHAKQAARAHRHICALAHGAPPPGQMACHKCGNRACINPNHLYWGTHEDNSRDADLHGTKPRGETCTQSRLTEAQVLAIRASTSPPRVIGPRYGVSASYITQIRYVGRWKHLPGIWSRRRQG